VESGLDWWGGYAIDHRNCRCQLVPWGFVGGSWSIMYYKEYTKGMALLFRIWLVLFVCDTTLLYCILYNYVFIAEINYMINSQP
jgi:hypothetical protein